MRKSLVVSALASAYAVLGAMSVASAAELGALTVYSNSGEPFDARLQVRDVDPKVEPLLVRLAPASVYQRVGKTSRINTSDLTLELESKSPYVVRIKGKSAVNAAEFPLIVELSEAGRISAKLYTVQLKKAAAPQPAASTGSAPAASAAGGAAAPDSAPVKDESTPVAARSAVPSAAGAVPSASSPAAAPRKSASRADSSAEAQAAAQKKLAQVRAAGPAAAPRAASGSVKLPLDPGDYDLEGPFEVRQGMTMWSIAKLYKDRYPQATMDQLLVGFVRANPGAYDGGRVNGVKVGSRLKAPSAADVERIPVDDAWALVRINPNADATKAPSRRALERARTQMKKQAPGLMARVSARAAEEQKAREARAEAQRKAREEEQARAQRAEEERLAAQRKAEEEKAAAAAAAAATTAAASGAALGGAGGSESAAAPASDPMGQNLAQEASGQSPAAAGGQPAQEQPADDHGAAAETAAPEAQIEEESSTSLWIGVIIILLLVVGAAVLYLKGRNRRRRDEQALRTVRFMRSEPASAEQLKGASQMAENRMQADQAAARGFGAAASNPAAASVTSHVVHPEAASGAAPAAHAPSSSGFNVASAYVPESQATAAPDVMDIKITNARNYLSVGSLDAAQALLLEVESDGSAQQKAQAREILETIRARRGS